MKARVVVLPLLPVIATTGPEICARAARARALKPASVSSTSATLRSPSGSGRPLAIKVALAPA